MEVSHMIKREFVQPTQDEIEERKKMYEEAEALGIDLMGYDGEKDCLKEKSWRSTNNDC